MSYYSKRFRETFPDAIIDTSVIEISIKPDGSGKLKIRSNVFTKATTKADGASPIERIDKLYDIDAQSIQEIIAKIGEITKIEIIGTI